MLRENIIPIVFGVDRNYLLPAFVVMNSILENSKSNYKFILISSDSIDVETDILLEKLKSKFLNFELQKIKIPSHIFEKCNINNAHLSYAAYNRLLIPEVVDDFDKCIYLDCDIIVNSDLKELYEIDINNKYIAGVKDCHVIQNNIEKHKKLLGFNSLERYINSGVLILNLQLMRKDNVISQFLEASKMETLYEDQDVINKCCGDKIYNIPLKYNLFHFYLGKDIKKLFKLPYEKSEFEFDWNKPIILHMGDIYKPWNSYIFKGSSKWWELAQIFSETRQYKFFKKRIENPERYIFSIKYILELCKKFDGIVIWGYTEYGRSLYDVLEKNGIKNIISFGDNDNKLIGLSYQSVKVGNFKMIQDKYNITNVMWLVSCKKAYRQVIQQLLDKGIESKNIIGGMNCYQKGRAYYRALDKIYYEYEIEEISFCEGREIEYIKKVINHSDVFEDEYLYLKNRYLLEEWICAE